MGAVAISTWLSLRILQSDLRFKLRQIVLAMNRLADGFDRRVDILQAVAGDDGHDGRVMGEFALAAELQQPRRSGHARGLAEHARVFGEVLLRCADLVVGDVDAEPAAVLDSVDGFIGVARNAYGDRVGVGVLLLRLPRLLPKPKIPSPSPTATPNGARNSALR